MLSSRFKGDWFEDCPRACSTLESKLVRLARSDLDVQRLLDAVSSVIRELRVMRLLALEGLVRETSPRHDDVTFSSDHDVRSIRFKLDRAHLERFRLTDALLDPVYPELRIEV